MATFIGVKHELMGLWEESKDVRIRKTPGGRRKKRGKTGGESGG